jgi:hypothetical protein
MTCTNVPDLSRRVQENVDDDEGSDDDAAVDVLFNDDGSRNVPCRCDAAADADSFLFARRLTCPCRDEEELARERERKLRLTDKQMGEVLRTVPKVPPNPRVRGDFNSAM